MAEIEPPSLLTLTILGRELERSIGSSAWITRHGPNRLTSIASATVPSSALLAVAQRSYMVEALFTSTSVRPNRSFTQSAIAATLIELSTSSWHATIRFPSGSSSRDLRKGEIAAKELDPEGNRIELLGGNLALAQIAGAEHHPEAEQGQLTAYLAAHAAVAARHHGHRQVKRHGHHQRRPCPRCSSWQSSCHPPSA